MPRPSLIGKEVRKLQPKLRMFADGSTEVNAIRAEHCSCIAVDVPVEVAPAVRGQQAVPLALDQALKEDPDLLKVPALEKLSNEAKVNVFIHTTDAADQNQTLIAGQSARKSNLATATLTLAQLRELLEKDNVMHVELGEPLADPNPERSTAKVDQPTESTRKFGSAEKHRYGEGVLVGIVDVQGFDFAHPDFLNPDGTTRFARIWDQAGATRPAPAQAADKVAHFRYGSEITADHMNRAIQQAPQVGVPAHELEPQSEMVESSHGTHVASIAAGKLGVCRKAAIAGVLISLPADDLERRRSFYDSTRVAHAVDYLFALAEKLKMPAVINVSLGTNGHAHDGSDAISRWIDSALSVPGRAVCVAAGNAGQEKPEFEGDIGYVMGRIHTSGNLSSAGLVRDIEWIVVGNGILDISENELELWFSSQDRVEVWLSPPPAGGRPRQWIGPVGPREYIENKPLPEGGFLSIYNELYNPANGANYIAIYLSPFFSKERIVGIPAGQWLVRLKGIEIRDGRYHGWIERDDPRRQGRIGPRETWSFPSFFSDRSAVDDSSVSSLACGNRIVCAANLDEAMDRISITSSQGPTRDGRFKPDVAAPGTNIVAANGFAGPDKRWVAMSGTSMAAPYVTGVMGLMLAIEPRLTGAQIEGIIRRTAMPLPGGNFAWSNNAGFGVLNPEECLAEAGKAAERIEKS